MSTLRQMSLTFHLIFEKGENAARPTGEAAREDSKISITPYSGSIDNLATVFSTSSPRDGGCLDFLEEGICRVVVRERGPVLGVMGYPLCLCPASRV